MLPTVTLKFTEPPRTGEQFLQAVRDANVGGAWKQISQSADSLEYTLQPLTLDELLADTKKTANQFTIPEVEALKTEYQDLPTELLLVRLEEAIQEYFALWDLVTEKGWSSYEVRKIKDLLREKYWGDKRFRPDPGSKPAQTRPVPQTTLVVDPADFD